MKIVYCGFGRAGTQCLLQLLKEGYSCSSIYVYTHDDEFNKDFLILLENLKISYTFQSINKSISELISFNGDILLSVYYKFIIKKEILSLFNGKSMNCHPSLLPDYKGCFSSVWALLNKEKQTGISFHYMLPEVDEGNIILQKKIDILKEDTAYSLYQKLITIFSNNFILAFNLLLKNHKGVSQKNLKSQNRYYGRNLPLNGVMEIKNADNESIEQFIKAMYFPPFSPAKFLLNGEEVKSINLKLENEEYLKYLTI